MMKDMKKNRIQGFVAGITASALLFGGIPALASSLDAALNSVNITVNGEKRAEKGDEFTLENGTKVPYSINYEGTTYLPVRNLADALGVPIEWDGKTDTVVIGEGPKSQSETILEAIGNNLTLPMGMMAMDDVVLTDQYGIDPEECFEEYSGQMSMMIVQSSELLVGEVKEGQMDKVKAGILSRQANLVENWKWYLPAQYELVKNYKLVTHGDYVLFAICEDSEKAVEVFNAAFTD